MLRQLRKLSDLRQYAIHATDGDIGRPEEVYFDDGTWAIRYLVVNTGTWLLGRRVLITPVAIGNLDDSTRILSLNLTRGRVKDSPPVDTEKPISRQYEEEYHRHYGWPRYWNASLMPGPRIAPPPLLTPPPGVEAHVENLHLRSSAEVTGYYIEARDGEIGHVEDFIIDDRDWVVRYLEVDTQNWWPGKKVLVGLAWVEHISWAEGKVSVNLARAVIKSAPEYDPARVISRDYEVQLYKYYSQRQD